MKITRLYAEDAVGKFHWDKAPSFGEDLDIMIAEYKGIPAYRRRRRPDPRVGMAICERKVWVGVPERTPSRSPLAGRDAGQRLATNTARHAHSSRPDAWSRERCSSASLGPALARYHPRDREGQVRLFRRDKSGEWDAPVTDEWQVSEGQHGGKRLIASFRTGARGLVGSPRYPIGPHCQPVARPRFQKGCQLATNWRNS